MYLLLTYDIATSTPQGRSRLRRIARICTDYGQRVQNSVFECEISEAEFVKVRSKLLDVIDSEQDSLRIYQLGKNYKNKIEHYGVKESYDISGPLIL